MKPENKHGSDGSDVDASAVERVYADRAATLAGQLTAVRSLDSRLSVVRLVVFIVGALFVGSALVERGSEASSLPQTLWALLAALSFSLFVFLVLWHRRVLDRRVELETRLKINEEAVARITRSWERLPEPRLSEAIARDPTARDLDLFGKVSLFSLLGAARTPLGRDTLAAWLTTVAPADVICARQRSVAELAPKLDLRERLQVAGDPIRQSSAKNAARFVDWVEETRAEIGAGVVRLSRSLSVATVLILGATALVPLDAGWAVGALAANAIVSLWFVSRIHHVYGLVSATKGEFGSYARMFEVLETSQQAAHLEADLSRRLERAVGEGSHAASRRLKALQRVLDCSNLRYSTLVYVALQWLFLWDFHVFAALMAWRERHRHDVRSWLDAAGEMEALCALAALAHENPGWSFPELHDEREIEAHGLGHPLIAPDVRVANDLPSLGHGRLLVVTGSNMSGKSTLLRAIGLNLILGRAGGPVCARRLVMPVPLLATSVRVDDSLADGVSLFLAELLRLKDVLSTVRRHRDGRDVTVVCLLDEILKGTNATERRIAVLQVLWNLLSHDAVGVVSTHDLDLATDEQLARVATVVHFRETLTEGGDEPIMDFDYRLRPGVVPTVNALKLLRLVGLDLSPRLDRK